MLLRIGSRGDAVQKLQEDLNLLCETGNLVIPVKLTADGIFGDLTANAVIRFQKDHNLEVDGVAGDQTLGRVAEAVLGNSTPANATPPAAGDKAALLQKFLTVAQREVGTREVGGNNCGVRIREYQRATEEEPGVWPWCAAFTDWCIRDWVAQADVQTALGWTGEEDKQRPTTAAAFGYIDWARKRNQIVLPPTIRPEPGMIVVYDFSHIGIVKTAIDSETFLAIEGNTNGRGDRDSTTGDGVWEKTRHNSLVRNFIGWHFIDTPSAADKKAPKALPADVIPQTRGIEGIPRECLEFIIDQEGMDQPYLFPGGDSGVTIGHGYDLGAESESDLRKQWADWLTDGQLNKLSTAIGLSGSKAEALCDNFTSIKITINAADDVFYRYTVPNYYKETTKAFPGIDEFPGEVQGAMLSLVFNRGSSIKGEKRKEMKGIQDLVKNGHHDAQTLGEIARLLREMKRLWEGKGLAGLIARREAEARMVESAIV